MACCEPTPCPDKCAKKRGTVCNGPEKWTVTVDVPDYKPNELCVKVTDKCVEVRGKKEPKGCCPPECFSEKYELACDADQCTIEWTYANCKLIITACKKKPPCC